MTFLPSELTPFFAFLFDHLGFAMGYSALVIGVLVGTFLWSTTFDR